MKGAPKNLARLADNAGNGLWKAGLKIAKAGAHVENLNPKAPGYRTELRAQIRKALKGNLKAEAFRLRLEEIQETMTEAKLGGRR